MTAQAAQSGAVPAEGRRPDLRVAPEPHDFHRPAKLDRERISRLRNLYESFATSAATTLSPPLRTRIRAELAGAGEVTFGAYLSSLPSPCVLAVAQLDPLPGWTILTLDGRSAGVVVDRLLGGPGRGAGPARQPTALEVRLSAGVLTAVADAFAATFTPVVELTPTIQSVETSPTLVDVAGPADPALAVSVRMQPDEGEEIEIGLCHAFATVHELLDRLRPAHEHASVPGPERDALAASLARVRVALAVRLTPTAVGVADMARLRPGDVLRLDHRVDAPALVVVEGAPMLRGFVGVTSQRLGLQVSSWIGQGEESDD